METKFVAAYITYTLKDNVLNIKENDVMIIPNEYLRKNPNEDIPYEKIKAVYLKKELKEDFTAKAEKDNEEPYIFSCEIHFYHQEKAIIENVIVKSGRAESDKSTSYEVFVKELLDKVKEFDTIKVYAYEGAKAKVLQKVNRVFPAIQIGSFVITGFAIFKILIKFFAKAIFFAFDFDVVLLIIAFFVWIMIKATNFYLKKNAQIVGNEEVPPHFFPSFERTKQQLLNS